MKTITENFVLYLILLCLALVLYSNAPDVATALREKMEKAVSVGEVRR